MMMTLCVAAGGAAGSVARYWFGLWAARTIGLSFPWGTLGVNVLGSIAMGVLAGAFHAWGDQPVWRALLATGVLGGFTTFSSMSLDVAVLADRSGWAMAVLYVGASLACGVGGLLMARQLVRGVLA